MIRVIEMTKEQREMVNINVWRTYAVALVLCFIGALALLAWRLDQMAEYIVTAAV